ncbi:hypothetical protein R3W88_016220 [Solanum pinnatisectum]|uniref:RNase H type-1 domain-containing protein n=1 Tax=Solanum pinnatisectum TaxID=50273 RepID=A0AAV9L118_9SOLN|nr:hypothetical protein R3W88_016220 [Solanum pinnatisectum]
MWWDNWCEKGPLAILYSDHVLNNNAKVMDYLMNMNKSREDLPEQIVLYIANIPIGDANDNDYVVWNITQDGQYTNSSAWQSIREVYRPIVRWRQVVWTKPVTEKIKFNTDGSYMQENDTGHLIMAFSVPTQCKSNNQAEAIAALYATEWCNQAGYDKYDLELDSMVVTNMFEEKDTNNVKLKNIIKRTVNAMEGAEVNFSHCYREANQVAYFLAKLASSSGNGTFYFSYQQLPKEVKGLFQLDRWQLPCVRRRYDKCNFFVS